MLLDSGSGALMLDPTASHQCRPLLPISRMGSIRSSRRSPEYVACERTADRAQQKAIDIRCMGSKCIQCYRGLSNEACVSGREEVKKYQRERPRTDAGAHSEPSGRRLRAVIVGQL